LVLPHSFLFASPATNYPYSSHIPAVTRNRFGGSPSPSSFALPRTFFSRYLVVNFMKSQLLQRMVPMAFRVDGLPLPPSLRPEALSELPKNANPFCPPMAFFAALY